MALSLNSILILSEVCKTRLVKVTIHGSLGISPHSQSPIKSLNATCSLWQTFQAQGPVLDIRAKKKHKREGKTFHFLHKRSQILIATNFFFIIFAFSKRHPVLLVPGVGPDIHHLHAQTVRILHTYIHRFDSRSGNGVRGRLFSSGKPKCDDKRSMRTRLVVVSAF